MSWPDYSIPSNTLKQTYFQGFVDISGGELILRNADASFNGNLRIRGNLSTSSAIIGSNLTVLSGGIVDFGNNAPAMSGASISNRSIPDSALSLNVPLLTTSDTHNTFTSTLTLSTTNTDSFFCINKFNTNSFIFMTNDGRIGYYGKTKENWTITPSGQITLLGGIIASSPQTIDFGTNAPIMSGANIYSGSIPASALSGGLPYVDLTSIQTVGGAKTFNADLSVRGNISSTGTATNLESITNPVYTQINSSSFIGIGINAEGTKIYGLTYSLGELNGIYTLTLNNVTNTWSTPTRLFQIQSTSNMAIASSESRGIFIGVSLNTVFNNEPYDKLYYFTPDGNYLLFDDVPTRSYNKCDITADGNTIVVSTTSSNDYIYYSKWNGTTFDALSPIINTGSPPGVANNRGLSISPDGRIIAYAQSINIVYYVIWNNFETYASYSILIQGLPPLEIMYLKIAENYTLFCATKNMYGGFSIYYSLYNPTSMEYSFFNLFYEDTVFNFKFFYFGLTVDNLNNYLYITTGYNGDGLHKLSYDVNLATNYSQLNSKWATIASTTAGQYYNYTLYVNGPTYITDNLYLDGFFSVGKDVTIYGNTEIIRNLTIYGNANISGGISATNPQTIDFGTNAPIMSGASITEGTIPASAIGGGLPYVDLSTDQTVAGIKTFSSPPIMSGASITEGTIPASAIGGGLPYVDLSTDQTVAGIKTFTSKLTLSTTNTDSFFCIDQFNTNSFIFMTNDCRIGYYGNTQANWLITPSGQITLLGGIIASSPQTIDFGTNAPFMSGANIAAGTIQANAIGGGLPYVDLTSIQTIAGAKTFSSIMTLNNGLTVSENTLIDRIGVGTSAVNTNYKLDISGNSHIKGNVYINKDNPVNILNLRIYNKSGTFNYDSMGFSLTGSSSMYDDNTRGYVFDFSGSSYYRLEKSPVNTASTTLSFWIYYTGQTSQNIIDSIWWPVYYNDSGKLTSWIYFTGAGEEARLTESTQKPINTWHHYAITISNTKISLYVDGSLNASASFTNYYTEGAWQRVSSTNPQYTNSGFVFGGGAGTIESISPIVGSNNFIGRLDDIRVYNVALSPSQVLDVYNNVGNETILSYVLDISGNVNIDGLLNSKNGIKSDSVQTIDFGTNAPFMSGANILEGTIPANAVIGGGSYVDLSNAQTIGGTKTFTNGIGVMKSSVTVGYALDVSGNVLATSFNATSDRRLKGNIGPLDSQWSNILSINPVSFDWKESKREDVGFIAQDIHSKYPKLKPDYSDVQDPESSVEEPIDLSGNPLYYAIDYGRMTPFLWKGLQETMQEIDSLKAENAQLKDLIQGLSERIASLET